MAILRGGRRIGNMDIRVGIPRDRSLDNVAGDKRLNRKFGGNPESTMGRFMGYVMEGEGFARTNRYLVDFILPRGVDLGIGDLTNLPPSERVAPSIPFEDEVRYSTGHGELNQMSEIQRGLRAFCSAVSMPGRNIDTKEFSTYGPMREVAYGHSYAGNIDLTFYADKYLRQRSFFEMWQQAIFNQNTHNVNFYDEYAGGMRIYQLGAFAGEQDRDRIAYGVEIYEAYPKTISAVAFTPEQDQIQKISVQMAYRKWSNMTMDQIGKYTVGSGFQMPSVKEGRQGLLGSILGKLPPEIRRAGRDVVQVIRRNLPIGEITGGKVFPPFL